MKNKDFGLGRMHIEDPRDAQFPIAAAIAKPAKQRTSRYWNANGWWGNQGNSPKCVGYSWAHWVEDGPVTHSGQAPIVTPDYIYKEAQIVDEWVGVNYEGTSVRAGAKVLQYAGFIDTYHWAMKESDIANAILTTGPVVIGSNWYETMFEPDKDGLIKIGGEIAGGHAFLLNGVSMKDKLYRIKNSWGKDWGKKGHAFISFDDVEKLLSDNGEACLALELKLATEK